MQKIDINDEFMFNPIQRALMKLLMLRPMHRNELAEKLSKPRTTVYDNLFTLMQKECVYTKSKKTGLVGRQYVYYFINKEMFE